MKIHREKWIKQSTDLLADKRKVISTKIRNKKRNTEHSVSYFVFPSKKLKGGGGGQQLM